MSSKEKRCANMCSVRAKFQYWGMVEATQITLSGKWAWRTSLAFPTLVLATPQHRNIATSSLFCVDAQAEQLSNTKELVASSDTHIDIVVQHRKILVHSLRTISMKQRLEEVETLASMLRSS